MFFGSVISYLSMGVVSALIPLGVLVYLVSWWLLTQAPKEDRLEMRNGRDALWTGLLFVVLNVVSMSGFGPRWLLHKWGVVAIEVSIDTLAYAHIIYAARFFRRLEWRTQGWVIQRANRYQGTINVATILFAIALVFDLGCPAMSFFRWYPRPTGLHVAASIAPVGILALSIAWGYWFFGVADVPAKLKAELEANRANPPAPNVAPNAGSDAAPGSSAGTA